MLSLNVSVIGNETHGGKCVDDEMSGKQVYPRFTHTLRYEVELDR